MPHTFRDIDKKLRIPGRIMQLVSRPSLRGFRVLNWFLRKSEGKDLKGTDSRTYHVERADRDGSIRVRVFRSEKQSEPLPIVLFLHGGGYAVGAPEQDGSMGIYKRLLKTHDCVIVSPDYRLSLTEPYPAGLNDCYDTLLWIKDNVDELGGRSNQIFVMGASAGGGLTLATCLRARDQGDVNIAFQMPLYPMIDDRQNLPSAVNNDMPVWSSKHNRLGWELYLRDLLEQGEDIPAYAAPARAESYANLPPAATFVGDLDPFYDETKAFVERLEADGVPIQFKIFEKVYHGFEQVMPKAEVSQRATYFMAEAFAYAVEHYFAEQV